MKTVIELKNMRFFAHHGVFSQETVVGNEFMVNLHIEADLPKHVNDNIEHTINYASVYELVKSEMQNTATYGECGIPDNGTNKSIISANCAS